MFKISVIMPVYNNEDHLRLAIESILNQSVFDFELILINDGSTDLSAQICTEYAEREPLLIKDIHQERSGFSKARNTGLQLAQGSYVYFANANNIFSPRMLEENLKLAEEKKAELVVFGFYQQNQVTLENIEQLPLLPFIPSKTRFRNHYRNYHNFYPYKLCNKLYQTKFLKTQKVLFNENLYTYENAFFNIDVYKDLNKVVFNRKSYFQVTIINPYDAQLHKQNVFELYLQVIEHLKDLLNYWEQLERYEDLVVKEYYRLLEVKTKNLVTSEVKRPHQELENEIERTLKEPEIAEALNKGDIVAAENIYEKLLWNNFRNQKTRAIIKMVNRKNRVDQLAGNIKRNFKKLI